MSTSNPEAPSDSQGPGNPTRHTAAGARSAPVADPGSYRDPSGFVFHDSGSVYRAVADADWQTVTALADSGLLASLVGSGDLIGSHLLAEDSPDHARLRSLFPDWRHFVRHEKVENIVYPYEWCFSMLVDAALLHLRMQKKLIEQGFSLKDATAFNVQFVRGKPVFIDLLSVETPRRLDLWMAFSQFCRMFLYPVLLFVKKGVSPRDIFLGSIEGMDSEHVLRLFGTWKSLQPSLFLDVYLQHRFDRQEPGQVRDLKVRLDQRNTSTASQVINLNRLTRKIQKLRHGMRSSGLWSKYERENTYSLEAKGDKGEYIRSFLEEASPGTVLDLGCNTGTYSVMAARSGARVLSVDSDHDCIENLYRTVGEENLEITPLITDLANPSPGIGFMNQERAPFLDRARADCVFALALVHHLLITARIPLEGVRDLLASVTNKYLVVEYVDRDDEMFQTLLALREDIYGTLSLNRFLKVFEETFETLKQQQISGTKRYLLTLRKRS